MYNLSCPYTHWSLIILLVISPLKKTVTKLLFLFLNCEFLVSNSMIKVAALPFTVMEAQIIDLYMFSGDSMDHGYPHCL